MLMISDKDLQITQSLRKAKDKEYKMLFTVAVDRIGQYLLLEMMQINENITISDINNLCVKYNLGFKTCIEILEELGVFPMGTFSILQAKGFNAKSKISIKACNVLAII
ncbi:MAG: hypothetical protein ACKPBH_23200 [Dolichospermum sp.]